MSMILACGGSTGNLKEKSLLEYGVPITILAPDSLEVNRSALGFQEDITLKGPDNFAIQVFVSDAVVNQVDKALAGQEESVRENPFFSSMVEENELGFIFKNQIDSTHSSFGFRHVRIMGGKEYTFQEPLLGSFTEEEARTIFEAVTHQAK